jgi:putative ATPase
LDEFIGQTHLLGPGKPLREALLLGRPHSMLLWGPPGTGKTTLAHIIASHADAQFISLSAVLGGVKDIRSAVDRARRTRQEQGRGTVLFVDEVHRFNKAQQDAFLPFVEDGTLVFVGATTENPSFEVNNALLSRARTYVLRALTDTDLGEVLAQALGDPERGLGAQALEIAPELLARIAAAADGDARRALSVLETSVELGIESSGVVRIVEDTVNEVLAGGGRRFDKGGDAFYEQISALHKSVRGSSPDAALYWLARMLDGGCDPLYIARRLVRMASEDIGNADPRALHLAMTAWDAQQRLGSPEGELALAQAVVFLASVPKSNAVYKAYGEAMHDARRLGSLEVPVHLRNAPTRLMKKLGYGRAYRYAHDEPEAYSAGERYFPEEMDERTYYNPVPRGLEIKIGERLERLRALDQEARRKDGK